MQQEKRSIRAEALKRRNALSAGDVEAGSKQILKLILSLPEYQKATDIYVYASIGNEVGTRRMIERMLLDGKNVACPRVTGKREMIFQYIRDYEELIPGYMKIPEPAADAPIADPSNGTILMIVPGVAFDPQGGRIGYGGGFYDTYLQKYPQIRTAAIAFSTQIVDDVNREEHDIVMQHVITEKGQLL